MVNQRKYVSNRRSYAYIRRTSDRLCKEHGLSVVMPGQDRGKSYAEWDAHRKDQLQQQYTEAKRQMQEYGIIKQNVDSILRTTLGKEQMQER